MKPVNPQGDRQIKLVTYPESHGLQARLLSMMQEPDLSILHLDGPIDKTNAGYFKNILSDIMDRKCTNVILNFSDVTCISGLAWIYIATSAQRFKSVNGTLCIANIRKNAQESLAMVPIDLNIDRYPTVEDAIAFFGCDDDIVIADPPLQENDSISNQPTEKIYIKEPSLNAKPVEDPAPAPVDISYPKSRIDELFMEPVSVGKKIRDSVHAFRSSIQKPDRKDMDSGRVSGDPSPDPAVGKKNSELKPLPIAPVVNEPLIKAKLPDDKAPKAVEKEKITVPDNKNAKKRFDPPLIQVEKQDPSHSKPGMPDQPEPHSTGLEKDPMLFPLKNGLRAEIHAVSLPGVPVVHELRVYGTIEHQNASHFDAILSDILERHYNNVILNLSELTYASSAAWGVLASAAQRFKSISGFFCIASLSDSVDELFRILQFDAIIDKYPTTDDAIAHFKRINAPTNPGAGDTSLESLSVQEKIQLVLSRSGPISPGQILKLLKSKEFGAEKISGARLKSVLREMNLDSQEQIERYYRSL
jgi:anti-anti-sigma factor